MPRRNQTVRPQDRTEAEIEQDAAEMAQAAVDATNAHRSTVPQTDAAPHTNGDTPPAPKEAKDAKFFRLAVKRVPAAIKRLRHVANLANRNQYEYTEAHAAKIIDALETELRALKQAFSGTKTPAEAWTL